MSRSAGCFETLPFSLVSSFEIFSFPRDVRFSPSGFAMNSRFFIGSFILLVVLVQFVRAADGPLQARTWDFDTTIPAGGYRTPKSIDLEGDWDPKVERGVVLDEIGFHARAGIQHWKVEGAILRKVQISGKRGVSLDAVDSVLEECEFWKDDNWYDFWWSTRWRFTNCIFTKKFVRGDLPPLDFSAHATGCTFYNVKLPSIGMKENPAGYLQKGEMGFEKCRFVQCDVPESFLAGTVNCVFEGCQFPAKRHPWPKETTAIKVTAYHTGQGSVPKSFINGPLTVEFLPMPREMQAGSTLAHTYRGGSVALQALPMPAQFTMIGTAQKRASEIPSAGSSPKPIAGTPARPVASATVTAVGSVDFHNIDEIIRPLPTGIELTKGGKLHVDGVAAANEWLAQSTAGRTVAVRLMVEAMQATKDEGYAFRVTGREQAITVRGTTVSAHFVALFRAGPAGALVGVTKNRDLPVRGLIQRAVIEGQGRTLALTVTIEEAKTP
jgi:hypothetical protein